MSKSTAAANSQSETNSTPVENLATALTPAIEGSLLGTAVGDALGLPYENMSARRIRKLCGRPTKYRFLFGRGMVSDDTEHSCLVAQSLATCGEDAELFEQDLARRLKWWLARLPAATGRATAKSLVKLWLGYSTSHSGVFSAGNGPSMRAPIIGAAMRDEQTMVDVVSRSARITHSDPKAAYGAIAVALATMMSRDEQVITGSEFLARLERLLPSDDAAIELCQLITGAVESVEAGESTTEYAFRALGRSGVTGYTYHTVPAAIHCWLSHPDDFKEAIVTMVECGGDTDSTAAIVGGIVGARVGRDGIPEGYLQKIWEWPCTVSWMTGLANVVESRNDTQSIPRLPAVRQFVRNLGFLFVVLLHALRRLAPPY